MKTCVLLFTFSLEPLLWRQFRLILSSIPYHFGNEFVEPYLLSALTCNHFTIMDARMNRDNWASLLLLVCFIKLIMATVLITADVTCVMCAFECGSILLANIWVTMSKDDRHKVDFSVHCQSELNSIDFDSWNDCKDEGGKYLFSNLLEIHLSFKHFRCATLASYLDNSLAPSISSIHLNSPPQSSVQANFDSLSKSDDSNSRLLQSVLSSLHNESTSACESETCQLLPHPKHVDSSKQAVRFNTNDVHILVSKLKRFKKFNFNSTRAKLSCLQSKHYKASKDYSTVACNSWEGAPRAEVSTESGIVSSCELAPCHRLEGSSICESWNLYGKHNSQCIEVERKRIGLLLIAMGMS